eukprot:2303730-Pyramimonas_sp.AAC.1
MRCGRSSGCFCLNSKGSFGLPMDASSLFFVILMPCLWTISWIFSSMRVYEVVRRFSTATHSTNHFTMCGGLLRYSRYLWEARFRVLVEVECSFS